jgi:hypothetical protein
LIEDAKLRITEGYVLRQEGDTIEIGDIFYKLEYLSFRDGEARWLTKDTYADLDEAVHAVLSGDSSLEMYRPLMYFK